MVEEDNPGGRWGCTICSYAYDPSLGDPRHGVPVGTAFEDISDNWRCPWCGAPKSKFIPEIEMIRGMEKGKDK